jgi:hypothetical protein
MVSRRTRTLVHAVIPVLAAALGIAVLRGPALAQEPPKRGERWNTVATADLRVLAQAPTRRVEQLAHDLLLGRAAVLAIAGAPDHQPPYSTTVVVFRDAQALAAYHRSADGGPAPDPLLHVLDRQGRLIALSLDADDRDLPRARELLAADALDQLVADPPWWLEAGLSGLAARLEPADGGSTLRELLPATSAEPAPAGQGANGGAGRTAPALRTWPPPDHLLGAGRDRHRGIAIELVRHLAHPRSERSSQLRRYLLLLRGGMPGDVAFEECFFTSFAALYADVATAAGRGGAPAIELDVPVPPPPPIAEEADHADVLLTLGDLLTRAAPWNTVAAELHYRGVLEARPGDARALRGIAALRDLDGRAQDAAALWEQALAATPPTDVVAPTLHAWSRLERFRRGVGARRGWEDPLPAEVASIRDLFLRAMRAAGDARAPVHALHGYGATFLYASDGFEPGLEALERAAALLPGDAEIAADLALLAAHAGDHERGWELWRRRVRDDAAPGLAAEIERLLAEESLHAADRSLREERPDAAMELLRRAAAEVREPATRAQIDELVRQIEKLAEQLVRDLLSDRFLVAFEEAKRLARERRFDEARRLLEPFAGQEVDPVVRDQARELVEQLDARIRETP